MANTKTKIETDIDGGYFLTVEMIKPIERKKCCDYLTKITEPMGLMVGLNVFDIRFYYKGKKVSIHTDGLIDKITLDIDGPDSSIDYFFREIALLCNNLV